MNAAIEMLNALRDGQAFEPIDIQLATLLLRRGAETGDRACAIALATAFASRACREGHSAITITQVVLQSRDAHALSSTLFPAALVEHDELWWRRTIAESPLVGDGSTLAPLVLRGDLLQLKRYHDAEQRIATRVRALTIAPVEGGIPAFSIITGGPGTGKTTFVAQKLVELSTTHPDLRVALAAPTGKAAARLTESIRQRLAEVTQTAGASIESPGEARTLHRLLGYSPASDRYRRYETDPLDDDLVIVDEASMVDVLMLDAVLRALKPGARLMLVGDHHQLASVDAGDVLGALVRSALSEPVGSPLRDSVTLLTRSWRFEQQPGIGTLASAILVGDADAVYRACTNEATPDVRLRASASTTDALLEPIVPNLERCLAAQDPNAMLDALDAFRVLAPEREGRVGVTGINAAVERWLTRHGRAVHDTWYHGRPVLVTANDYATGVFNGDIGVVWRDGAQVAVYFRTVDGSTRAIAPGRLPSVETAWAMTVHKSQGSEFDDVLVVVPDYDSRVMSRELLYTAVTRAKRGVTIAGSAGAIRAAVVRITGRTSGLGDRLKQVDPESVS